MCRSPRKGTPPLQSWRRFKGPRRPPSTPPATPSASAHEDDKLGEGKWRSWEDINSGIALRIESQLEVGCCQDAPHSPAAPEAEMRHEGLPEHQNLRARSGRGRPGQCKGLRATGPQSPGSKEARNTDQPIQGKRGETSPADLQLAWRHAALRHTRCPLG